MISKTRKQMLHYSYRFWIMNINCEIIHCYIFSIENKCVVIIADSSSYGKTSLIEFKSDNRKQGVQKFRN